MAVPDFKLRTNLFLLTVHKEPVFSPLHRTFSRRLQINPSLNCYAKLKFGTL